MAVLKHQAHAVKGLNEGLSKMHTAIKGKANKKPSKKMKR